ncbi:DUF4405 domain-containing protein, partial [[Clostridium] innocuum]|nr:DUF4405 domain-containing protein [[Clostridium] innocuum]
MKPKVIIKLAVDVLMTMAMLFLMGYHFWGKILHEWVGAGMFLLFIAHHILNFSWYRSIFKGKYTAVRVITICIDLLVLLAMLMQMYSGIVMSRYVFDFIPINGGISLARRLHILGAYWGFLLMSLHLGLHWNMILGMFRKAAGIKSKAKSRSMIAFVIGLVIAGYGLWAFIGRDFPTHLFLKSEFVFLDYSEPKILFYID